MGGVLVYHFSYIAACGGTVIIYTMIELFTSVDNAVMSQAYTLMNTSQVYDRSSAMMWLYFVLAGLFMGGVMLLYNRFCLKRWD